MGWGVALLPLRTGDETQALGRRRRCSSFCGCQSDHERYLCDSKCGDALRGQLNRPYFLLQCIVTLVDAIDALNKQTCHGGACEAVQQFVRHVHPHALRPEIGSTD